jgi:hypothetical protein
VVLHLLVEGWPVRHFALPKPTSATKQQREPLGKYMACWKSPISIYKPCLMTPEGISNWIA